MFRLKSMLTFAAVFSACGACGAMYLYSRYITHQGDASQASETEPGRSTVVGDPMLVQLSDAGRTFLWQTEQKAFRILYKASPRITAALCRRDRDELVGLLDADFRGLIVSPGSAEIATRGCAEFQYFRAGDVTADRAEFVDWLLELTRPFGALQAQLPLLYLSPADRMRPNGPWHGTWILRIFGERIDGGPGEVVVRGKFTAEHLPDDLAEATGWISSWDVENAVIARAPHTLMEEIGARAGLPIARLHDNWNEPRENFLGTPGGVYACDYDNDGLVDLLVIDPTFVAIYAGRGAGRFEDMTADSGLPLEPPLNALAAFADFDNDGDEDLILCGAVFENRRGHFVRRGQLSLVPEMNGFAIADYDRDGRVDVYVSNDAPPPRRATGRTSWIDDKSGVPNQLFRNLGNFQFADVTDEAGAAAGRRSTFTSVWLDADSDDWPDLYVINELGSNLLLRNERNGRFSEHRVGPEHDGFAMGVSAGDVDGDGNIDLYIGNMYSKAGQRIIANIPPDEYSPELIERMKSFVSGNLLLVNRPGLKFEPPASSSIAGVGWAYGTGMMDLDGDGRLDLYATAGFASFSRKEPDG